MGFYIISKMLVILIKVNPHRLRISIAFFGLLPYTVGDGGISVIALMV